MTYTLEYHDGNGNEFEVLNATCSSWIGLTDEFNKLSAYQGYDWASLTDDISDKQQIREMFASLGSSTFQWDEIEDIRIFRICVAVLKAYTEIIQGDKRENEIMFTYT